MPISFIKVTGITVKELKDAIRDWPETNAEGCPTEVWIMTGHTRSTPCTQILTLNLDSQSADILFVPSIYE